MPASEGPLVIAVVLNWRDAESTRTCVESLVAEPAVSHTVLVDNESTGELRSIESDGVTLIEQEENLGFSRGVNIGVRAALEQGAQAVLVINNDALVESGAVAELIETWRAHGDRTGIVAPMVRYADGTLQSSGGRLRPFDASTTDLVEPGEANYLTWACILLPRATTESIGLLDERFFMYWEDVDYGLRVLDAGLDLLVAERASVVHEKSKSHGRAGTAIDRYGARGLVVLARTRRGVLLYVGLPLRITARVLRRLLEGRPAHAAAVLKGVREGWKAT
jgi:GT2 family glycosyltransferase